MLPLLWCLAWCSGIALEIARPGQMSAVVPACVAAVAAALALVQWRRKGGGMVLVLIAAVLAGIARGRTEVAAPPVPTGAGLVRVDVVGASAPAGASCEVLGRADGADEMWALRIPAEICPLAAGEALWVRAGDLSLRRGAPWPGAAAREPARDGAVAALEAAHAWRARPPGTGYWRAVAELRHAAVAAGRAEPALGFVVASVLGQPAALSPERRAELRRAGLGHVVAVSGMNVAIAAALVRAPLLRLGLLFGGSPLVAVLLAWAPVLAYLGLAGWEPPALRAAVMFALTQVAVLVGRPAHGMTALAVSAAALLAWRPAWALDPGLHLSVAAMAVLVHPDAPRGLVAQSWRVSWGTLPIVLVHFGTGSMIGVIANLIAVPVFTLWVLPLGVLGLLAMPWCGAAALGPAALGGQVIVDVAALASGVPEVPLGALAGVAGIGLVWRLRGVHERVAAWVPGGAVCAAVIAAVVWTSGGREVEAPRGWVAIGGTRSAAVIVPATSDPRVACVRDPWLGAEAWPELLAALGYRAAAEVEAPRSPPAAEAVRAELGRAGMLAEGTCPEVPKLKALKGALAGCMARVGGKKVTVREGAGGAECWDGARFVGLAEAGAERDGPEVPR